MLHGRPHWHKENGRQWELMRLERMQGAWNAKPSLDFFLGASEASQKAINRDLDSGDLGQFSNQQGQGYERT